MAGVELSSIWVIVVPVSVVDWDSHFGRIAIIKTISTSEIFIPVEILRIVNIRVMIESVPILGVVGLSPRTPVGLLSLR